MFFAIMLTILVTLPEEGKGQGCSPGETLVEFYMMYPTSSGLCSLYVSYCLLYTPPPLESIKISNLSINIEARCGLELSILDYSNLRAFVKQEILTERLPIPVMPPCSTVANPIPPLKVIFYTAARCIKYINEPNNLIYFPSGHFRIVPCQNTGSCEIVEEVCWDYSLEPVDLRRTIVSQQIIGGVNDCETSIPQDWIPDGKTMNDYFETECYFTICE